MYGAETASVHTPAFFCDPTRGIAGCSPAAAKEFQNTTVTAHSQVTEDAEDATHT